MGVWSYPFIKNGLCDLGRENEDLDLESNPDLIQRQLARFWTPDFLYPRSLQRLFGTKTWFMD